MDQSIMKCIFVVLLISPALQLKEDARLEAEKLSANGNANSKSVVRSITNNEFASKPSITTPTTPIQATSTMAVPLPTTTALLAPERVQNLKVLPGKDNSSEAIATFDCPLKANGKIANFWITYQALNNIDTSNKCQTIKPIENKSGKKVQFEERNSCSYSVTVPVTEDTQYVFKVFAMNMFNGTSANKTYVAKAGASDVVTNLNVSLVTASSAQVQWSPPTYSKGNILSYEMRVQNTDRSCTVKLACTGIEEQSIETSPECQMFNGNTAGTFTNHQVTYNLNKLTPYTDYSVDVLVINNYGKGVSKNITFKTKESAPERVQNLKVLPVKDNSSEAKITFGCPLKPNGKIANFWITYQALNNTGTSNKCQTIKPIENKSGMKVQLEERNSCSYSVTVPVTEDTQYVFKVFAMNMFNGTSANKTYVAKAGASDVVTNLNVSLVTASSAQVQWSPPTYSKGNILSYEMRVQNTDRSCTVKLACTGIEEQSIETSPECQMFNGNTAGTFTNHQVTYNLNKLTPYTDYSVDVLVINNYGKGVSKNITFKTKESAPERVQNLKVLPVKDNSSEAKITFGCPLKPNGKIANFWITYQALNNTGTSNKCQTIKPIENKSGMKVQLEERNSCSYSVTVPVTEDTQYVFKVFAMNMFNGTSANKTYVAKAGASDVVTNLNVSLVTASSAQVQWSPPTYSKGNILSYEMRVQNTDRSCTVKLACTGIEEQSIETSPECQMFNGNTAGTFTNHQVTYNLNKLTPYTDYSVDVLVINNYGKGVSKNITFKTKESAPERVQNLKVLPVKDNSSEAKITFGCPLKPNGKIANFWITYQALNNTGTSNKCQTIKPIENKSGMKVQFEERNYCSYSVTVPVTEDTQYVFKVFAMNMFNGTSANKTYVAKAGVSDPVTGLTFTGVNSTQSTVLWSPPLHPRGNILGYELRWTSKEGCHSIQLTCMRNQDDDGQDLKKDNQVSSECKQLNENPVATLTDKQVTYDLTGLKPYTFYSIDVFVINNKGKSAKSSNTFKTSISEPGKVGNLRVTPLTLNYTAVDVSFSSPQKPNGVIAKYILSYYMLSKGYTNPACEILTQITNRTDIAIQADSSNTGIYSKIVEVSPWTTYSFQVTAYNQQLGIPAVINYTTGSHVPGTIDDLHIYNWTSDSVVVTWKPPPLPNGFLLGYRLQLNRLQSQVDECYTAAELSCSGEKISDIPTEAWCDTDRIVNVKVKVSNPLSYKFTGLLPYTRYELLAVAVNKQGSGILSSVFFNSSEAAPGPVTNLTFSSASGNYSSLDLHFTCLEEDERHGKIQYYVITYTTNTETSDSKCGMSAVNQNSSGITIDDDGSCNFSRRVPVTPERHYNFTVQAYNSVQGTIASFEKFTPYGPPGPVRELKTRAITNSSVTVQWSTPEVVNGMIHSYQLSIELPERCIFRFWTDCGDFDVKQENRKPEKECKDTDIKPTVDKIKHNGDLHYITVNDLLSYTNYTVSVVPINSNGSGPEALVVFKTDIGVPDRPNGFHATANNASTITLFWSPSKHQAGPTNYIIGVYGNVDHITNNCSNVKELHVQGYSTSNRVVTNLCSYTNYTFTIMASTSAGKSSNISADQIVRTGIGIPAAPQNIVATSVSPFIVNLSWTPSEHQAGPTTYIIEVFGELDQGSGYYTSVQTLNVQGFSTTSLTVQDLLSYTNYTFTIRSSTTAGESATIDTAVRTKPTGAVPPRNLTVHNVTASSVRLSWVPSSHQCGLTDYVVGVEEQPHLQADCYNLSRTIIVHGFNNNRVDVNNLTSYWKYRFSVRARTSVLPDSSPISVEQQTLQSAPGRVENIQVSALPNNYTAVKLTWKCPEERKRHGPISHFTVQYSDKVYTLGHFPDGEPCRKAQTEVHTAILSVHPEQSYIFTVFATAKYEGLKTVSESFNAAAGKPPTEISTEVFTMAASKTSESTTDTTFLVSVSSDLLRDSTNGHIVMTGLLVMKDKAVVDVPNNVTDLKKWKEWKEWKKDYKGTYRPTPDNWLIQQIRRKRSANSDSLSTTEFIVGANANCENLQDSHCNGPLEAETTYKVISVACTTAGCTASDPYGPFKTKAKSIVAAVVGGILAALVVVGLVVGILVYRRRRNRKQSKYADDDPEEEKEESVDKTRPKKLCDFPRLVDEYHKDSERLFSLEWREIGLYSPSHPYENATLEANRVKNRYTNILAYDHTRVKLVPKTEDEGSDYINANYIQGYSRPREYIATQGPLAGTVDDFWQMIWEQNVPIIVQLTGLYEGGRRKLSQYWPEEVNVPQTYGEVQVEIVSLSPMNKYTIKVFNVSLGSRSRQVKHFFLQDWQDYNANLKTGDVIDFTRYVRNELKPTDKGPVLVHCSAGVGRTGTFICVDYFLQVIDKADLEDSIDIFSFVLKMRDCRPLMVQSESQYTFVHDAVKEMIERKKKALAGEVDEVLYENQAFEPEEDPEDNIYENT